MTILSLPWEIAAYETFTGREAFGRSSGMQIKRQVPREPSTPYVFKGYTFNQIRSPI